MDEFRYPMKPSNPLEESRVYEHEAMNTTFVLRLLGMEEFAARSLAQHCFDLIDRLEGQLSRFLEASDVARINRLPKGETLYISEECHQCLLLAMNAAVQTHGLFDITLGSRIEHQKSGADGPVPELTGRLTVHPDVPAVSCEEPGRNIDLGGIGKGFALDQLRGLLNEWEPDGALLSAGASSIMACGKRPWPIQLGGSDSGVRVVLESCSLSASGTGIQGSHLVHPWGEEAMPQHPSERIWVLADSAATAEAWSTALMLVELEEIPEVIEGCTDVSRVYAERDGQVMQVI